MKKETKIIIGVILIIIVYFVVSTLKSGSLLPTDNYVKETSDFDFTPDIIQLAESLKGDNDLQTVKNTIQYTYKNVQYDPEVSMTYCFVEKASDVLDLGKGDCVSMSRLNVALLRANGIPARTVGGCLDYNGQCNTVFAMVVEKDVPTSYILDNKKRGMLHEWVEVYFNNQWHLVESTLGVIFDADCSNYNFFGYDNNQYERCMISDNSFVNECRGVI